MKIVFNVKFFLDGKFVPMKFHEKLNILVVFGKIMFSLITSY
jgi:hypothetical protein